MIARLEYPDIIALVFSRRNMLTEIKVKLGAMENRYFLKGAKPISLQVDTGMHGDEIGVIPSVKDVLKSHLSQLETLLYIPEVSPSAVKMGTRKNAQGNDINRKFIEGTSDQEANLTMDIIRCLKPAVCVSFHEDPKRLYIYDAGRFSLEGSASLATLREEVQTLGVPLLTGIDDERDSALGIDFSHGYRHFPLKTQTGEKGFLGSWALSSNLAERALTIEIPANLEPGLKDKVVDSVFRNLMINLLENKEKNAE